MPERKHIPRQPAEFRVRGIRLSNEKIVPAAPATARPALWPLRNSEAPASRFANGASGRSATPGSDRSNADKARIKGLERENKELRTANEILKKASACFAQAEIDRSFRR